MQVMQSKRFVIFSEQQLAHITPQWTRDSGVKQSRSPG